MWLLWSSFNAIIFVIQKNNFVVVPFYMVDRLVCVSVTIHFFLVTIKRELGTAKMITWEISPWDLTKMDLWYAFKVLHVHDEHWSTLTTNVTTGCWDNQHIRSVRHFHLHHCQCLRTFPEVMSRLNVLIRDGRSETWGGRVLIALEFLSTPLTSAGLPSDVIMSDTWNDIVFLGERRAFVSFTGRFSSYNVFQIHLSQSDRWKISQDDYRTWDIASVNLPRTA